MDAKAFNDFKFADAFETWEMQSGYPVIHVKLDRNEQQFQITQKRYLNAASNSVDTSSWFVPLNFAHAGNPDFDDTRVTHYFTNRSSNESILSTANIEGFNDNAWFIFNKQQLGYYRVNYESENWYNIIRALKSENYIHIHVLNRAQLVDDSLNFAFDGYVGFDVALDIVAYLHRETDYLPWASVVNYLDRLDNLLQGSESHNLFNQFVNHLVSRAYAKHGLNQKAGEELLTKHIRELAINWSCRSGNARCLEESYAQIQAVMTEQKSIPKPLEIAFLCNGLKGSNKSDEFVYFWSKLRQSTDQADRLRLIDGLACATDPDIIKSFLESSTSFNSDVDYRDHERNRIFNSILSSSSVGVSSILDFLSKTSNEAEYA